MNKKYLYFILTALLAVSLVVGIQRATAVTPGLYEVEGNPSCASLYQGTVISGPDTDLLDLGPLFGFKYDANPTGDVSSTLTDNAPWVVTSGPQDAVNSVSIFNVVISDGEGVQFDWSASLGIDAVIVKAQDANAYVYAPEAFGSSGLIAPDGKAVSHVEFCYDYELAAEKSAEAEFTRTYTWEITKGVEPAAHTGWFGDEFTSAYEVFVDQTVSDSAWKVTGEILVSNPTPYAVTFSVSDFVDGVEAEVTCPTLTLAAGESTTCTYEASLGGAVDGTNSATVSTTHEYVEGATATAAYAFGEPTTTIGYPTINVTDFFDGDLTGEALGSAAGDFTFEYTRDFACPTDEGMYTDGVYTKTFANTAEIDETGQSDDAQVDLTCYKPVVSKDADTEWFKSFEWTITKAVDPDSHTGWFGEIFTSAYEVTVDQTITEDGFRAFGSIFVTNPSGEDITVNVADAVNGTDATVDCGGGATSLLVPAGETASCSWTLDLSDGTQLVNTATVSFNGYDFLATADVIFGDPVVEGLETINVTDYFNGDLEGQPLGSASGDFTFEYEREFTCPEADSELYIEGKYTTSFPNTAKIDETGQSDDANVDLTCYVPLVSKDADTEWFKEYTWEITKSVDPDSHTGFPGDEFSSTYEVFVDQTISEGGFRAFGSILVTNPSAEAITVDVADDVNGTAAAVDCGGGAASLMVPAGESASCSWTVNLADGTSLVNTATISFKGVDFLARADVIFGDPVVVGFPTINVTDFFDGDLVGESLGSASADHTFTYTRPFVCPTDKELYKEGGFFRSFPNTAKIDETGQSDDAQVDLTCKGKAKAKVIKITRPNPLSGIGQFPFVFQLINPSGEVVEIQELPGAGEVEFATAISTPGSWMVKEILPAGWITEKDTCEFTVDFSEGMEKTYTCEFLNKEKGRVKVLKLTNGVEDPVKEWSFTIYKLVGPMTLGEVVAMDTTPPALLDFGNVNLDPRQKYALCEEGLPAGWKSAWMFDQSGDGSWVEVFPWNPDSGEDVGNRCIDFRVESGKTAMFKIDNIVKDGQPRTPGYWKNWNTCSGGNQAWVAEKNGGPAEGFWLLDDLLPQMIGSLEVSTCEMGVSVLDARSLDSNKKMSKFADFTLARALLAYQLNQGAEACFSAEAAAAAAEAGELLVAVGYDGSDGKLRRGADYQRALELYEILDAYNNGMYCGGSHD